MQNRYNSEKPKTNIKMERMNEIVTFWIPIYGFFRILSVICLASVLISFTILALFTINYIGSSYDILVGLAVYSLVCIGVLYYTIKCIIRRGEIRFDGRMLQIDYHGFKKRTLIIPKEEISMIICVGKGEAIKTGIGKSESTFHSSFQKLIFMFKKDQRNILMIMPGWRKNEIEWIAHNLRNAIGIPEPSQKQIEKISKRVNFSTQEMDGDLRTKSEDNLEELESTGMI